MSKDSKVSNFSKMVVANQLSYNMPDHITLVDSRSMKRYYAQRSSYTASDSMVFDLATGSDYIHPQNSYLTFKVQALDGVTPVAGTFGELGASAVNLINSIVLQNGEELERVDQVNTLAYIKQMYETDFHESASVGQLMGKTFDAYVPDLEAGVQVIIPLSKLLGFFNTDRLIPSQVLAGARMTIRLEDADRAIQFSSAPTSGGYSITDPSIMLDSFNLTDSAQLFLQKKAGGDKGLVYSFKTYTHTNVSIGSGTSRTSSTIGKPVSDVLDSYVKVREQAVVSTDDSFASLAWDESTKFRFKMGSLQFPDQKIENKAEAYAMTLYATDKFRDKKQPLAVSYDDFGSSQAVIAMTFERHHALKLAGLPINTGGRSLVIDWQVDAQPDNIQLDAFVSHLQVVSGYADGSIVVKL